MPRLKANQVPRLRQHKASGRAVVTLSGRDVYCGAWGTKEAEAEYRRVTAEWLASGRRAPVKARGVTVAGLVEEWVAWCSGRYTKRGQPTSYARATRHIGRDLVSLYGEEPAAELRPGWLRALTETWRRKGVSVHTCNQYLATIRSLVRWAVSREILAGEVLVRIQAVQPVSFRDGFPENPGVRTVPEEAVDAALAQLAGLRQRVPRAILEFMRYTGARPQEACSVRIKDLDRSGDIWVYQVAPAWNKTDHIRRDRQILVGPRAQQVLLPWIDRALEVRGWNSEGHLFRGRGGKPYRPNSLAVATRRACAAAGVPAFRPNQLRHNFATRVRANGGLDAAGFLLGHSHTSQTVVYAEPDTSLAFQIARDLG